MKNRWFGLSTLALSVSAAFVFVACSGDDITEGPSTDAGGGDGSLADVSIPDANTGDVISIADAGVSRPPWALYTYNYSDQSDLAAFSLDAGAVDGVLNYPSKYGATSIASDGPWALEQFTDIVAKLDPKAPWNVTSSWTVLGADDAGTSPYADPFKVVAGPAGKDYVMRFNRNEVAVIDTTKTGLNQAPTKFIDLTQYLAGSDEDGAIDMVSGVYVASQHRLYVLLGNLDLFLVDPKGFFTLCGATHSEIVAIDTDTDTLVSAVDGGASTTATVLGGYNAIALVPDLARNRLLAISAGCSDSGPPDSGIAGATHMREVDAIDIDTGLASVALDLTAQDYPSGFAQTDATHIALGFGFGFSGANLWDVTTSSLGAPISAPDVFAYDGQGHLVGAQAQFLADGGQSESLVSIRLDDGGVTSLGAPAFRKLPAFVSAVDFWAP